MTPEDARKLLGGYATGTLTDAERQALFAAALEDQQLFDELAGEQSIHELLRDPAARAEMLDAVAERPRLWAWWRPAAAALAMAAIGAVVVMMPRKKATPPPPQIVAEVKPPEPVVVPPPAQIETPSPATRRDAAPVRKPKEFQPPPPPAPAPAADTAIVEVPKASVPAAGVVGGVPGGIAGGTPGGVLGGIISASPSAAPPPPPPPVRFETAPRSNAFVPSTAEAVPLVAASGLSATPSARTLFYGARLPASPTRARVQTSATMAAPAPAPRDLGLRYSAVRKDGDSFVAADPENLGASDVLALRFTANVNGYLSIAGGKPVALTAMEPYTTPALGPGATEVRVIFARSPQTTIASPVTLLTEVVAGEVYVVNRTPNAPVAFTVTLKRK